MSTPGFSLRSGQRELISGPAGDIELMFHPAQSEGALAEQGYVAVVCHPHPLYAGTMDNKVVTTMVRAYCELGVPAVRFNFRGVGATSGEHDQGRGEGDDLESVVDWALNQAGGDKLLLSGFSFGSMVAMNRYSRFAAIQHLALVAPPLGRLLDSPPVEFSCPLTVVVAGADEVVDAAATLEWERSLCSVHNLVLLDDASHFFHGRLTELRERLQDAVLSLLP